MENKTAYEYVKDCHKIMSREFTQRKRNMEIRSKEEQNIIGNLMTSTEIEIDKKIKQILDECYKLLTPEEKSRISGEPLQEPSIEIKSETMKQGPINSINTPSPIVPTTTDSTIISEAINTGAPIFENKTIS